MQIELAPEAILSLTNGQFAEITTKRISGYKKKSRQNRLSVFKRGAKKSLGIFLLHVFNYQINKGKSIK